VTSTDVDQILTIVAEQKPSLLIVDSIQTIMTADLLGTSGSVGQLRESTARIIEVAKRMNLPTFFGGACD